MTRADYIELVKNAGGFQKLDPGTQRHILAAKGDEMEAYAKIFGDEQKNILAAKKEFVVTTIQIIKDYKKNQKIIITVGLKKAEAKAHKQDNDLSEQLLKEINNL